MTRAAAAMAFFLAFASGAQAVEPPSLAARIEAMRAAEAAGQAPKGEIPAELLPLAELIGDAVRARASGAEGADEAALAERRLAIAASLAAACPPCALELRLEAAEDALLRGRAAGALDVAIAIGLPTAEELAASARLEAVAARALGAPAVVAAIGPDADLATDPIAFRALSLVGFARLAEMDRLRLAADVAAAPGRLARGDARISALRAEAAATLARAARTELPIKPALAANLALARARAEPDAAARAPLLAQAAASFDPAIALAAKVEAWCASPRTAPFPGAGSRGVDALELLAACAEARAALAEGEAIARVASPFERVALRAASDDFSRVRGVLDALAARTASIDAFAAPAAAEQPIVAALALLAQGRAAFDGAPEAAERAAADRLVGPAIALRVAELAAASGDLSRAARIVTAAVRDFPALPAARPAVDLAIEIRRARAGRDAAAESEFDETLAVALARFPNDPERDAWALARADLALAAEHHAAEPARARQAVLVIAPNGPNAARRALREAEADWIALGSKRRDAEALAALAALANDVARLLATTPESARAEALAAAIALAGGRHEEAAERAERALVDPRIDARAAERAALAFLEAREELAKPPQIPAPIARESARSTAVAARIDAEIARRARTLSEAFLAKPAEAGAAIAPADAIARFVEVLAIRGEAAPASARMTAALVGGDPAAALRIAESADPADREAALLRAEALRASGGAEALAEAFAAMKSLAPAAATERDLLWWRAQAGMLEIARATGARPADIVARVNRLALLDSGFGDPRLARRFEALRREEAR
jgi:hypothetical protein